MTNCPSPGPAHAAIGVPDEHRTAVRSTVKLNIMSLCMYAAMRQ
jgi:hypothetical protein